MMDTIGPLAYHQNREDVLEQLEKYNTVFMTSVRLDEIKIDSIVLTSMKDQTRQTVQADAVVISIGNRSNIELLEELKKDFPGIESVGDAVQPGKIADAVRIAYEVALRI